MVFFPSYAFMEAVYHEYAGIAEEDNGVEIVLQEAHMTEEKREEFLKQFRERDSILGFCVLGGIFSEGIDLRSDSLIGAIIVGTGLPQVCRERQILKDYFEKKGYDGFDYAYRFPGMNKVLQAAGRVIRTENDVGIVVLLDERFQSRNSRNLFPREWNGGQIVSHGNVVEKVKEFWKGRH